MSGEWRRRLGLSSPGGEARQVGMLSQEQGWQEGLGFRSLRGGHVPLVRCRIMLSSTFCLQQRVGSSCTRRCQCTIKQVAPTPGQPRLSTAWCEDMVLHYDGSHLLEGQLHLHLGLPTLQPRLSSASVSHTQDQALPRAVQGLPGTVGQGPFSTPPCLSLSFRAVLGDSVGPKILRG